MPQFSAVDENRPHHGQFESRQFLWHDYETFGTHPALDRPSQFAAIRTDLELNICGEPMEWFCAPADDVLPHPAACLITGITPQEAQRRGVNEQRFAQLIHAEMMEPGTCSAGYNNLKFDDEFSRNIFYRNLIDPYEREYKNGNSRWDLIGLARMCYALRPDGIEWPMKEPGKPSFKLEDLTAANGIHHQGAHDATADVRATIDFARLIRNCQPRLFDWALAMRNQQQVLKMLDVLNPDPILHVSARIPATRGCISMFLPLSVYPDRRKSVVAIDLMADPAGLIELDAEAIEDLVFTARDAIPEGMQRIPLKGIHGNRVPMLAPLSTLRGADTRRIGLDVDRCLQNAERIKRRLEEIRPKVMHVFSRKPDREPEDPDLMLYAGFFERHDRKLMDQVLRAEARALGDAHWPFRDPRLETMLFRYRARNFPDTLNRKEAERWLEDRRRRLIEAPLAGHSGLAQLKDELQSLRTEHRDHGEANRVLDQLEAWYLAVESELTGSGP